MSHLQENNTSYIKHLVRSWKWAFMLFIHGLFPFVWETRVSNEICNNKNNKTRAYLLKNMYGIEEK